MASHSDLQLLQREQAGAVPATAPLRGAELAIIVPTLLVQCLQGIHWEVLFVDDYSPDDTAGTVRQLAQQNRRVRCVQRLGRRGLASACLEGILATSAPYMAVIDGHLQHDERLLPEMFKQLRAGEVEVVVGSRYVQGAGVGRWSKTRVLVSRIATRLSKSLVTPGLADPLSGFFAMRRDAFQSGQRNCHIPWSLLLEIFPG